MDDSPIIKPSCPNCGFMICSCFDLETHSELISKIVPIKINRLEAYRRWLKERTEERENPPDKKGLAK